MPSMCLGPRSAVRRLLQEFFLNESADPTQKPKASAPVDEVALVRLARAGDSGAFEALVRHFEPRVRAIARQMVGDPDDAQDVTQEVFIRLHRSIGRFTHRGKLSTWLYRVTMNMAIDFQRKRARIRKAEGEAPRLAVSSGSGDLKMALERILQRLTLRQRRVFVMRDLQGFELSEVARILNCSAVTVRVHLHNARRRVQDLMKGEMD